jgi:iron complex transport system substrate-binding protein
MRKTAFFTPVFIGVLFFLLAACGQRAQDPAPGGAGRTVTDAVGRTVLVPAAPGHIICSGPGCLRYALYLQGADMLVGVDSLETRVNSLDARPYALANPRLKNLPVFGEFMGRDNPELILGLSPSPELIFKTYPEMGQDAAQLQGKTGIPVVTLNYGDLLDGRPDFYASLRLMAEVLHKQDRAEEIIAFIDSCLADLSRRTKDIADQDRKTCYIGGIAFKGPHGLQSTEPAYPPFVFTGTPNAGLGEKGPAYVNVSKEKIIDWDPEIIFIDLATMQSDPKANAIYELKHDPAYRNLRAVKTGNVYAVIPYNWYAQNYGSTLADAYYVGKVLYPEAFADINPAEKADEIYRFLTGKPLFAELNRIFSGLLFNRVRL